MKSIIGGDMCARKAPDLCSRTQTRKLLDQNGLVRMHAVLTVNGSLYASIDHNQALGANEAWFDELGHI